MNEQTIERFKQAVFDGGGVWVGVQESVPPLPDMVLFNHPTSRSTLALPAPADNPLAFDFSTQVRKKIVTHEKQEKKMSITGGIGGIGSTGLQPLFTPGKLTAKLVSVYDKIDHIAKNGFNKAQNYHYIKANDLIHAVRNALRELNVYAEINFDFVGAPFTIARAKEKDAPFSAVCVKCTAVFHDAETGETKTSSGLGTGADIGDKAAFKAQTGALKYALKNAFLIPDDEDPEADESVDEPDFQSAKQPKKSSSGDNPKSQRATTENHQGKPPETQKTAPSAEPESSTKQNSSATKEDRLPTDEELDKYRSEFDVIATELAEKAGLKPSPKLPIKRKLLGYLIKTTAAKDVVHVTKQQWDGFFLAVSDAKARENGLATLVTGINEANGVEEK